MLKSYTKPTLVASQGLFSKATLGYEDTGSKANSIWQKIDLYSVAVSKSSSTSHISRPSHSQNAGMIHYSYEI